MARSTKKFKEYKVDLRIQRLLEAGRDDAEDPEGTEPVQRQIDEIVYKSFKDSRNYICLGMMQGFTRICGFAGFIIALLAVIEDEGLEN